MRVRQQRKLTSPEHRPFDSLVFDNSVDNPLLSRTSWAMYIAPGYDAGFPGGMAPYSPV